MSQPAAAPSSLPRPRYLETPPPLVFPSEELVHETQLHMELRILLYLLLKDHLGLAATVGSDQFVYYVASDPEQCVAPDVFVRLVPSGEDIEVWKTWERGAPDVAVEIASHSDAPEPSWQEKLQRYASLGARQVVRFDSRAIEGARLRLWDRVNERLAELEVIGDCAPSGVLDLTWVVAPTGNRPVTLRIATDPAGKDLVPTLAQARQAEAQARQVAEARAQQAEARIRELEEELRRRGG